LLPYHRILALTLVVCVGVVAPSAGQSNAPSEDGADGIDEHLGDIVPLDLRFTDESGAEVRLGDLVDRPTIVSLVYYSCPSVCRPLLEEVTVMLGKLQGMEMEPGVDYRVLTISFDATDSPDGSARLKDEYTSSLSDGFPPSAWTFLTGDSAAVATFTGAVGFRYRRAGKDFAHPTTLVILSPKGKITRYLIGSEYLAADIKLSLLEASAGRVGPTIAKFFKYCFSYDPEGRKYVLNVTRVVGASSVIGLALFAVFLTAGGRRRSKEVG
jgi:protein SCO1/2